MGPAIDVVLVDDHSLFVRGLELLLGAAGDGRVRVVGSTDRPQMALEVVARCAPQVVVVDLAMPPPGGLEVIRALRRRFPGLRILVLSGVEGVTEPLAALDSGADGFLPKTSDPERLVPPLLALLDGWQVVSDELLHHLLERARRPGGGLLETLDEDERSLWRRVAHGASTDVLADELHVSERSAKRLVATLLRKIGVGSRVEAAGLAGRCGLLDEPPADGTSTRPARASSWHPWPGAGA